MKANLMMLFPFKYFKDSRLPHVCTYIYIYVTIHIRSTQGPYFMPLYLLVQH